jgi:hypothetical protein
MIQKYHSPGRPQGRQYPGRADSGIGSRQISVLIWTIAKNRACRRDGAAYSSFIAG